MSQDVRLASFALSLFPTTEVLCAYAAPIAQYFADEYERWVCFGSFSVPQELRGRLWVVGFRTPGVTAQCCLFSPEQMAGSLVTIASDSDADVRSAVLDFYPGRVYQMAARAIGTSGAENYMVVRTASLAPPEEA